MLTAKLVTTDTEIDQIYTLSKANLVSTLSAEEKAKEGFVTWVYTPEILKALHTVIPSVIIKDGDELAAYCLSLSPACVDIYPPMKGTDDTIAKLLYNGRPLGEQRIYYCGQICVAQEYRGQGLVDMLYQYHRKNFSKEFDLIATEISTANPRSLKAHQKTGFERIATVTENDGEWDIVLWDWKATGLPEMHGL